MMKALRTTLLALLLIFVSLPSEFREPLMAAIKRTKKQDDINVNGNGSGYQINYLKFIFGSKKFVYSIYIFGNSAV